MSTSSRLSVRSKFPAPMVMGTVGAAPRELPGFFKKISVPNQVVLMGERISRNRQNPEAQQDKKRSTTEYESADCIPSLGRKTDRNDGQDYCCNRRSQTEVIEDHRQNQLAAAKERHADQVRHFFVGGKCIPEHQVHQRTQYGETQ